MAFSVGKCSGVFVVSSWPYEKQEGQDVAVKKVT